MEKNSKVKIRSHKGKVAIYGLNRDGSLQRYPWIIRDTKEEVIKRLAEVTFGHYEIVEEVKK